MWDSKCFGGGRQFVQGARCDAHTDPTMMFLASSVFAAVLSVMTREGSYLTAVPEVHFPIRIHRAWNSSILTPSDSATAGFPEKRRETLWSNSISSLATSTRSPPSRGSCQASGRKNESRNGSKHVSRIEGLAIPFAHAASFHPRL